MEDRNENDHGTHSGMNHGMGMMLLGCGVPMAAIALLPRLGVSSAASLAIGIGGMLAMHGGMMLVHRLRDRRAGKHAEMASIGHDHH